MAKQGRTGKPGKAARRLRRVLCVLLAFGFVTGMTSCTRRFFRRAADREVNEVLSEKDQYPAWGIEQFHVYPDPRARFADPTNPDRPPVPPDDPAAYHSSPQSQRPGKAGVGRVEGTAYLDLLAMWDAENRAKRKTQPTAQQPYGPGDSGQPAEQLPPPKPVSTDSSANGYATRQHDYLITLEQAVELGLINSRDYQDAREALYLAALPVTFQRYSFAAQFFFTEQAIRERTGQESLSGQHNRWNFNTTTGFSKLFSTGATLLLNLANQTVVELTGTHPKHTTSVSTLTLDLLQPLLRGGGRAVTLEPLTQAERNLLYQIRNFARFREGFFVAVAGGGQAQDPTTQLQFSLLGFGPTGSTQGFLPTVRQAKIMENDRKNVQTLQEYFARFVALASPGGNVSQLQVDQVEQNLLRGRSTVLQDEQSYGSLMDQFKIQLGLPTNLPLELDDSELLPLMQVFDRYEEIYLQLAAIRDEANKYYAADFIPKLRAAFRRVVTESPLVQGTRFQKEILDRWAVWEKLTLKQVIQRIADERVARQKLLDLQVALEQKGKGLSDAERARLKKLVSEIERLDDDIDLGLFERALRDYESQPWKNAPDAEARKRQQERFFLAAVETLILLLHQASGERQEQLGEMWPKAPRLCLNGVDLLRVPDEEALEVAGQAALINRFDLMNRRAQLVDAWRQIAVDANALLGTFNVEYHMDVTTPAGLAQPLNFNGHRMRNQLILNTQLPLVRKLERNTYRSTLIDFQRARRGLMLAEDQVLANVRNEIRQLRYFAENYTIQQRQIVLGYRTRDNALESFLAPPAPVAGGGAGGGADIVALTQQLLSQQQQLVQAQNQLLQVWVNYLTTRMQLYRDLELMPLDLRGVWTDEIATRECANGANRPADAAPCNPASAPEPRRRDSDGVSEWLPISRSLPPAEEAARMESRH